MKLCYHSVPSVLVRGTQCSPSSQQSKRGTHTLSSSESICDGGGDDEEFILSQLAAAAVVSPPQHVTPPPSTVSIKIKLALIPPP